MLEEVIRIRHVGTGKYLGIADDHMELELKNSANNLHCLFLMKSEMANKKAPKYSDDYVSTEAMITNGQRVII